MKYWLFDGNDVVGPFTLGEIAARPDFSATSLICAEDASEDAAGWQMASFFEAFRFNPVTGRVDGVFPTEKQAGAVMPAAVRESKMQTSADDLPPMQVRQVTPAPQPAVQPVAQSPATQQPPADLITESNTNWVPPEKVEKTIPPAKKTVSQTQPKQTAQPTETKPEQPKQQPVAKTPAKQPAVQTDVPQTVAPKPRKKEDFSFVRLSRSKRLQAPPSPVALAREDVDLILPQTPQEQPVQEQPQEPLPQENQSTQVPPENQPETKTEELPEPETEIVSTCTLPIVNEILTQSDLPKLPEGNFPSVPLPAEPQFELKEALPDGDNTPVAQAIEPAPQPSPELTPEPEATYTAPQRPSTETVNELEQELVPQNQVEDLMEEQFLEKPTRKKAHIVLCLLLLAALASAGWFFGRPYLRAFMASHTQVQPEVEQPVAPAVEQPPVEEPAPPAPQPALQPAPKPVTAADKALSAVQNYQLSGNKGTVASYFDRIYASHLQQGYTANWSVEPLHKNIYIVKYRLTKTRTEPIVYVFQADGAREKLTGALNNVALDLIGRI